MKVLYFVIIFLLINSCNQEKNNSWRKLECGLYMSPSGELGFPSAPELIGIPQSDLEPERCPNYFITHIEWGDTTRLIHIVDTLTFTNLGACFFKDKNRIYSYYAMCDGGYFNILKEDTTNFRIIGDYYAKDDKNIYYMSKTPMLDIDYTSFESKKGWGVLGKDKYHFYAFGHTISKEEFYNNLPK